MTAGGSDRGAGTVLVIGLVAVVVVLVGAFGVVAAGVRDRAQAQSAADLAALAGAGSIALPAGLRLAAPDDGAACRTAGEAAERNGAVLVGCDVRAGGVVAVEVRAGATGAAATARAGPAPSRPPP